MANPFGIVEDDQPAVGTATGNPFGIIDEEEEEEEILIGNPFGKLEEEPEATPPVASRSTSSLFSPARQGNEGTFSDYLKLFPAGFEELAQGMPRGMHQQVGLWGEAASEAIVGAEDYRDARERAKKVRDIDGFLTNIEKGLPVDDSPYAKKQTKEDLDLLRKVRDENLTVLGEKYGMGLEDIRNLEYIKADKMPTPSTFGAVPIARTSEEILDVEKFLRKPIDDKMKDSKIAQMAQGHLEQAEWWKQLQEERQEKWDIDPVVANSTIGQFIKSAGMAPGFIAAAALGPLGIGMTESAMFSFVEDDARATAAAKGEEFNPQEHIVELTKSAVGQALLERAFGFERVADDILRAVGTKTKMSLKDFMKQVFVRSQISGLEEAATEPTQGMWEDLVASVSYDEGRELFSGEALKKRFIEAVSGYALGTLMSGSMTAVATAPSVTTDTQEQGLFIPKGAPEVEFREFAPYKMPDGRMEFIEQWDIIDPKGYRGYNESEATVSRRTLEGWGYKLPSKVREGELQEKIKTALETEAIERASEEINEDQEILKEITGLEESLQAEEQKPLDPVEELMPVIDKEDKVILEKDIDEELDFVSPTDEEAANAIDKLIADTIEEIQQRHKDEILKRNANADPVTWEFSEAEIKLLENDLRQRMNRDVSGKDTDTSQFKMIDFVDITEAEAMAAVDRVIAETVPKIRRDYRSASKKRNPNADPVTWELSEADERMLENELRERLQREAEEKSEAWKKLTPQERQIIRLQQQVEKEKVKYNERLAAVKSNFDAKLAKGQEQFDQRMRKTVERYNERLNKAKEESKQRLARARERMKESLAKKNEVIALLKLKHSQKLEQQKIRAGERLATEVKRRINDIKQKFDERMNLRQSIKELEDMIDQLPTAIRGRFHGFGTLSKIVSAEKQRAFLEKAARRTENLLDEYTLRQNQNVLKNLIKKIRKSKRMPKELEVFNTIHEYGMMDRDVADGRAEALLAKKDQLTEEETEEVFMLKTFGGKLNPQETIGFTGEQMRLAREEAEYILRENRSRMKARIEIDQMRINRMKELAIMEMIRPEDELLTTKELQKVEQQRTKIRKALRDLDDFAVNRHSGLEMLLDNLKVKDARFTGFFQEQIVTPIFQAQMRTETQNRQDLSNLGNFLRENVVMDKGVTRRGKLMNLMRAWSEKNLNVTYTHDGKHFPVPMSKWEAITMWMQYQDQTLESSFEKMEITEETMAEVERLIGDDGKAVGEYLLNEYKRFGKSIRAVVANVDNYIIPILDNYSPISRMIEGKVEDDSMTLTDMDQVRKVREKNGSLKARVDNTHELAFKPANEVFAQHMYQMNHYLNFARIAKDSRSIFANRTVRRAVDQRSGGGEAMKLIDSVLDDIFRGGIDRAKYDSWANRIISNLAVSKLAFNLTSAAKQLGSIPAYSNEMPWEQWLKYSAQFWGHPLENAKTLINTEYIQNRLSSSYDRDLKNLARQSTDQGIANIRNWRDRMMFMTRMGDVGAIIVGGHALYKYTYDQEMAKHGDEGRARAAAEKKFSQATDRAQQSSQTFAQGYWQRGGSFVKLFTMFMTTPIQYHRITANAIKAYAQGRIPASQMMKTVFIYHVLLPQIFTAMGSAFIGLWSDDDDEVESFWRRQGAAAITGNFNALFIVGDMISSTISAIVEKDAEFMTRQSIPMLDELSDISFGSYKVADYFLGDQDSDDLVDGRDKLLGAILSFAGMPYDPIKKQIDGAYEAFYGETEHPWLRLMGYSDYAIFEEDE